jgi:hypothetical protein
MFDLGAILFDLLAGRPPFLGEHALDVIQQASERPARNCALSRLAFDRDLKRSAPNLWARTAAALSHSW